VIKVVHVPFSYYPDAVGGTEVYVHSLSHHLDALEITSIIAAPAHTSARYEYDGHLVERFAHAPTHRLEAIYGGGDSIAADNFLAILETHRPDVLHLHAFTAAASVLLVEGARSRGIPVVFTYHTPSATCAIGTLMPAERTVCDGEMLGGRCTQCTLRERGLSKRASRIVAALPIAFGRRLSDAGAGGRLTTALRSRELLQLRHEASRTLFDAAARIVVPSEWARQTLLLNAVPREKIILSRQGLSTAHQTPVPDRKEPDGILRLAFFGRLDRTKGVDTVIHAIRSMPNERVLLDIYGVAADGMAGRYEEELHGLAARDARIRFKEPVTSAAVSRTMAGYDALVVPSRFLETGPLVVYEAFAAGIPVIGSRHGGIAELVHDSVDGLLVEPESIDGWCAAIRSLTREPQLLARLRSGVKAPRTMETVAREMANLYRELMSPSETHAMVQEVA